MRRFFLVAVAAVTTVFLAAGPAMAGADWDWDDDDLVGVDPGGSVDDPVSGGPGSEGPVFVDPEPYPEYVYVPYCPSNGITITDPETGEYQMDDALCTGFSTMCPEDERRYWIYVRYRDPDGGFPDGPQFSNEGVTCRGADDPPPENAPRQITIDDIIDSARAVAPGVEIATEPGARSYVNFPTNMYVDDADQQVNVDVLGFDIPLSFSAEDVTWNFGDGASATGAGVADAEVGQEGAVEHAYRRSGSYAIGVTVDYTVTATLPNGETLQMPGTISGSGGPYQLGVGELQSIVKKVR